MNDNCRVTPFSAEETGVKIEPDTDMCCEDIPADALVYYNALYCHPGSANFSAHPTHLYPPCLPEIPPPVDIPVITPPPPPPGDGDSVTPDPVVEPPISNPPPVEPPPTEPPVVTPPDDPAPPDGVTEPPVDPDPPVVVLPDPTPPPVTVSFRYPRGMWYGSNNWGIEPMPDLQKSLGTSFPQYLNQAQTRGIRMSFKVFGAYSKQQNTVGDPELNPASPLYDPTAVVGGFCLRKAKALITAAQTIFPNMKPFVTNGVAICHVILDDFTDNASAIWSGRIPTAAEIDALAQHSKSVTGWSTFPTAARGPADYLARIKPAGYNYLDIAWVQTNQNSATDPHAFFVSQIAKAKSVKLGLMSGGNLLNGGAAADPWSISPDRPSPRKGMSPTEVRRLGDAIAAIGDFQTLGIFFWVDQSPATGTTDYYKRTDIQAAMNYVKSVVKDLKIGPVNYR